MQLENKGNFTELLKLIGEFDKTVANKLAENPRNVRYTDKDIYNKIFHIMADMVKGEISTEDKKTKQFTLMVDKSKALSKSKQISIVVLFLREEVHEEFLHLRMQKPGC